MIKITEYNDLDFRALNNRMAEQANAEIERTVAEILQDVRTRGDEALLDYTERFDGVRPQPLSVKPQEIDEAIALVGDEFLSILREAAENISSFHVEQRREGFTIEKDGIELGQRFTAVEKAGLYVPGGTASYPSTVLMDSIPAKIAGVDELILCTPPGKDGKIAPAILAAAHVAGVDRIFKCGGAQAIAAMAFGTESIPRVYKIVGPGNIFVATAKRMVFGQVSIDMIAGPSDVLVIADENANAVCVAADMLAQAEHDKMATAILVTTSRRLAEDTAQELEQQLARLPRSEIAGASIRNNGKIILCADLDEAVECANRIAPEHLELCVANAKSLLPLVRNAGSIFLGYSSPEALGDYFAGPNHTLPTMGTARFASPLSVDDFIKKSSVTSYSNEALLRAADKIAAFARAEGLEAHARSVEVRK
ncbi:MAG: histidinol dehydrogenase [Oscillospiraceae bacterium]|nr:histidinol dehydrogenase [Oscillospiraceae bacterium]